MKIDAKNLYYRQLNVLVHRALENGTREIILDNVNGQRYIAGGLSTEIKIIVNGVAGNDLGAFMNGPRITVNSNAQDGIGNTMNAGKIVVRGAAGDIVGHSMRGGKIYIEGNAGYRVGIHMKSYKDLYPAIIIGGSCGDFLGEYMSGGLIAVLGLNREKGIPIVGNYVGTGMHSGTIFIRGQLKDYQLGKEVKAFKLNKADQSRLYPYLEEYCRDLHLKFNKILREKFIKLTPTSLRPYGKLYAY